MRGAVPGEATGAGTRWPSAPTARVPTSRRPSSARRRRPAVRQWGGGSPHPSGGSEAKPRGQKSHRPPPEVNQRARWRGGRWRRRPKGTRAAGGRTHHGLPEYVFISFVCFSFVFPIGGWGSHYYRQGRSGARETVYKNTTAFGGVAVITLWVAYGGIANKRLHTHTRVGCI